jgi:hypothetical protein
MKLMDIEEQRVQNEHLEIELADAKTQISLAKGHSRELKNAIENIA